MNTSRPFFKLSLLLLFLIIFSSLAIQCRLLPKMDIQEVIPEAEVIISRMPLFAGKSNDQPVVVRWVTSGVEKPLVLERVTLIFAEGGDLAGLDTVSASYTGEASPVNFGAALPSSGKVVLEGSTELTGNNHVLDFNLLLKSDAGLMTRFEVGAIELTFKNYKPLTVHPAESYIHRTALLLRAAGQDSCDTYRIPGLVTTARGTLIAVYDNRYNNSKDLQEDIDIGMSRSTDGGETWEPMRVIMDMGEYGGRPERLNGVGDPSVLYDPTTHTLWVAALWISGSAPDKMLWWASKPGMTPVETGQFLLVKSTDDGLTWSDPINITPKIKDPAWQLLFQGPGRGITTRDGILVFPAQFKADIGEKSLDGGAYTCHSTIVWSKDGGQSWHIGTGAKSNTTEAQVVELADGSLMLNMRDDRNRSDKGASNGRAVAVTRDLGKTWTLHPSSNSALPEPNCMASLITADLPIGSAQQQVLFFSNPNNKEARTNMTIKASLDGGLSWPETLQQELYSAPSFGYSCLTMVDENNVGILYEGTKELIFQKVPVSEILNLQEKQ